MSDIAIRWNNANYDYVFNSWEGPVGRHIKRRSLRLQMQAISKAGLRTGALKAAIGTHFGHHGKALEARIGANVEGGRDGDRGYSFWHHDGTKPHIIRAREAQALRFMMHGQFVFATSVRHPGTRPNHYLTDFLKEAVS